MSNPAWGIKRICPNCGARYYDFNKSPPACPTCGTAYDPEALLKSRRTRAAAVEEPVKRKKPVPLIGEDETPELGEDQEIDAVMEEEDVDMSDPELEVTNEVSDEALLEDDADDLGDELEEVEVEDGDD